MVTFPPRPPDLHFLDEGDGDGGGEGGGEGGEGELHGVFVVGQGGDDAHVAGEVAVDDTGGAPGGEVLVGGGVGEVAAQGVFGGIAQEHKGFHLPVGDGGRGSGPAQGVDVCCIVDAGADFLCVGRTAVEEAEVLQG